MTVYYSVFTNSSLRKALRLPPAAMFRALLGGFLVLSLGLIAFPGVSISQDIKEMSYRNDGNYLAQLQVQWTTPSGNVCGGAPAYESSLTPRKLTTTIDLTGAFKINRALSDLPYCTDTAISQGRLTIEPGSSVSGVVVIGRNTIRKCVSVSRNLTFSPDGGAVTYFTAGTESSGNQCQRD